MGRTKRTRCKRRQTTYEEKHLGFDVRFQHLVQWMKNNGWTHSLQLSPTDFPSTGRGLKTLQYIASGDTIVNIPGKLLMTVETASKSLFGWLFKRKCFLTQQVLAAHLLFERHLEDESFWVKYIMSLPEKVGTPVFTSSEEVNALPEDLSHTVNSFKDSVTKLFTEILDSISSDDRCPHCLVNISQIFTLDNFLWAWFVINSRAVYICPEHNSDHGLDLSDSNCLALAPFLDMFNHSNEAKVQAYVSKFDGFYQVKTMKPYKRFSQVFIHYGDHSNVKLFLEYGFIMPKNIHDTLQLTFEEIHSAVQEQGQSNISKLTYNFLKSHDILSNLHLSAEGISWSAKVLIYVLLFSETIDPKTIQLKVFSNNYTESEICEIQKIGRILVDKKSTVFKGHLKKMIDYKDSNILGNISRSFHMAIDLYNEYLNILLCCDKSFN